MHDEKTYKPFCFTNIFPYSPRIQAGERKSLFISSPDEKIIATVENSLERVREEKTTLKIGSMRFYAENWDRIVISFSSDFSVRTFTPILARLQPNERKQPFHFYWSDQYPQELLLRKVSDNIKKKYAKYTGKEVAREGAVFQQAKMTSKKLVSNQILLHGYPHKTLASHWSFRFEQPYDESLLNFAVDAGFGERNSLGYGFVVPS
ncbi:MAG: CRISPR-associated endoribonuclease Cas6 [Nitrososphaerales archaeon]